MPKWCPATVAAKKVWADGLFTLSIATEQVQPFEPGQFLHLALGDEANRINRPYSVASPHGGVLDFFVVVVETGALSPKLWRLNEGDRIDVSERAAGSFTLKKAPDAAVLWLCSTGTGLAPYIAMLRTRQPWERYRKIVVVHGVRNESDLGYTAELKAMEANSGGQMKLIQSLTREEKPSLLHGRIPSLLDDGRLEQCAGQTLEKDNSTVLLCGNPAMLDEMEQKLGERGLRQHRSKSPGQIVLERYW